MNRILCLDYGHVRIGVALSVTETFAASQDYIDVKKGKVFETIKELVSLNECSKIVVGLPISLNGQDTQKTLEVKAFVRELESHIDIPITLWDERLSSYAADDMLQESNVKHKKRKGMRDSLAAQIILQSYLDSKGD